MILFKYGWGFLNESLKSQGQESIKLEFKNLYDRSMNLRIHVSLRVPSLNLWLYTVRLTWRAWTVVRGLDSSIKWHILFELK